MKLNLDFFKDKTILITGHTGFKGSWLSYILFLCGANVIGYSLNPPTEPNLFNLLNLKDKIISIIGDVRDSEKLSETFSKYQPELVIHLAAQPLVRESYKDPVYTYETNVLGTLNILECLRNFGCTKSFLNVTTDKVYENNDILNHKFKEDEKLDGFDPYSNSKSCSELITHSYKKSFFADGMVRISTARAGNVLGGGDFSADRIIPDCIKAVLSNKQIIVRNPFSTRPYQHVLEPLFTYLMILEQQYYNEKYSGYFNVGPDEIDFVTTGDLVNLFCKYWGHGASWINISDCGPHEAAFLALDTTLLKKTFNWSPVWHIEKTIEKIVNFTKILRDRPTEIELEVEKEIKEFIRDGKIDGLK